MIYELFSVTNETIFELSDLMNVTVRGNDFRVFYMMRRSSFIPL